MEEQDEKRGRGRPATGNAMSSAERQKAYRDRKREVKIAIINSRNASQEIPVEGPRRLIVELDKAHKAFEALQQECARLAEQLAAEKRINQELRARLQALESKSVTRNDKSRQK